MSIQIKIFDGEGIQLRCVTSLVEKGQGKPGNPVKTFHIYIEKNHLFIVDNIWNSLATKKYSYEKEKSDLKRTRELAIRSEAIERDGICIDLTSFKASENLKKEDEKK